MRCSILLCKIGSVRVPQPLLTIEALTVERGGRIVLSSLDLIINAGEVTLASGRNGAGKSTLLRTLAGLLAPSAGRIVHAGASEEVRGVELVHYLGYEDALKPSLSVGENLRFWATMLVAHPESGSALGRGAALSPRDALDAFGIARLHDLPAAYLSAGQKRRVALARLLLAPRPVWLLDEPLIALDTDAQAVLTTIMGDHVASGGTILVASHQPLALPHRILDLNGAPSAPVGVDTETGA